MTNQRPVVLTIAGFDPSSGAGVTADVKTIAAHDCYGVACISALTVQSTAGVGQVEAVNPALLGASLDKLASDEEFAAVHIGMLGTSAVVYVVADFLAKYRPPNVVLDPVLKSSSGFELLDNEGYQVLITRLIPLAQVITPNLEEAARLAGLPITTHKDMLSAAKNLHGLGAQTVVITGGHLKEHAADLLSFNGNQEFFPAKLISSKATHGTGCAFSTSLSCNLALGRSLREAVPLAQEYVRRAIEAAYPIGHGAGPINHLFRL